MVVRHWGRKDLQSYLEEGGSLSPHQLSALTSPFAGLPYYNTPSVFDLEKSQLVSQLLPMPTQTGNGAPTQGLKERLTFRDFPFRGMVDTGLEGHTAPQAAAHLASLPIPLHPLPAGKTNEEGCCFYVPGDQRPDFGLGRKTST